MTQANNVHPIRRNTVEPVAESVIERKTAALLRKHREGKKVVSMLKQLRTPSP